MKEILFNVVGSNNRCYLSNLKNYGKTITNSTRIIRYFNKFEKNILKEIEHKKYFKKDNKYSNLLKRIPIKIGSISFVLGFFISQNGYISVLNYYVLIAILSILYYKILSLDKRRTKKGSIEYSKWLHSLMHRTKIDSAIKNLSSSSGSSYSSGSGFGGGSSDGGSGGRGGGWSRF